MTAIDGRLRRKIGQIQRDRGIVVADAVADFGPLPTRPEPVRAGYAVLHMLTQWFLRTIRNGVHAWMVRRTVATLLSLDDRMLADIGVTRAEIEFCVRVLSAMSHGPVSNPNLGPELSANPCD